MHVRMNRILDARKDSSASHMFVPRPIDYCIVSLYKPKGDKKLIGLKKTYVRVIHLLFNTVGVWTFLTLSTCYIEARGCY